MQRFKRKLIAEIKFSGLFCPSKRGEKFKIFKRASKGFTVCMDPYNKMDKVAEAIAGDSLMKFATKLID